MDEDILTKILKVAFILFVIWAFWWFGFRDMDLSEDPGYWKAQPDYGTGRPQSAGESDSAKWDLPFDPEYPPDFPPEPPHYDFPEWPY